MKRIVPVLSILAILSGIAMTQIPADPPSVAKIDENQKTIDTLKGEIAALKQLQLVQAQPPAPMPLKAPPKKFPRGLKPTPRHKIFATPRHKILKAAPTQFAIVPKQLSMWLNDVDGDCVTAEEAFAKAAWSIQCGLPELFVPDSEVQRWASKYGFLNGANLTDVMDQMAKDGFTVGGVNYKDGPYTSVDYGNESVLQNAIAQGTVNIGIDANALPSTAGNNQGWFATGGTPGEFNNEDHCVSLTGYGPAEYLYSQLGVTMPAGLAGKSGYLLFTWSTIGFVDHDWIMSTVGEAWLRNPTTPGQSPVNPTTVAVPNLVGQTSVAAQAALTALGLMYYLQGAGAFDPNAIVTTQSPVAGTQVPTGSYVTLTCAVAPPVPPTGDITITVPAGTPAGTYTIGGSTGTVVGTITVNGTTYDVVEQNSRPVPITPPRGWVEDSRFNGSILAAIKKKAPEAEATWTKVAADGENHPLFMRLLYHRMKQSKEGQALIQQYKPGPGALPPGFLQNLADFLAKIMPLVLDILKVFGLGVTHHMPAPSPWLESGAYHCLAA